MDETQAEWHYLQGLARREDGDFQVSFPEGRLGTCVALSYWLYEEFTVYFCRIVQDALREYSDAIQLNPRHFQALAARGYVYVWTTVSGRKYLRKGYIIKASPSDLMPR